MEPIHALLLGIIEGITEFLPISSTGHLIILNQWISFSERFTATFDVVIQLGAILAVAIYFWDRLWPFGKDAAKNKSIWNVWFKTLVAVAPSLVAGALFKDIIENRLFNALTVAIALVVGGIAQVDARCAGERGGATVVAGTEQRQ